MPQIAAIVCTYNRHQLLTDALNSLQAQTLDASRYEIVVVDNSTDLTARTRFWEGASEAGNMRVVTEDIPGLSRARNIGRRATLAPIVAYVDDDALVAPQWLEALLQIFESDPQVAIAGGPVDPIWPEMAPPWLHQWLQGFLTIVDLGTQRRALAQGEWLAGTNIAFRRDALEAAGGFNETLGRVRGSLLSNEELAVTQQIRQAGFLSYYVPEARVFHRVHADRLSQAWLRRRVSWQAVSDLLATAGQEHETGQLWGEVGDYLMGLPVELRNLRGLFYDTPDPELFEKQCRAIGALVHLLLNSGRDPDPVPF